MSEPSGVGRAKERLKKRLTATPHTYTVNYAVAAVVDKADLGPLLSDHDRLTRANASIGADLLAIGRLCGQRENEYPLQAVDRLTRELREVAQRAEKAEAALAAEKSSGDRLGRELIEARNELFVERERADKMTNECQLWMDTCRDAEERAERLEKALREIEHCNANTPFVMIAREALRSAAPDPTPNRGARAARQEEREALRDYVVRRRSHDNPGSVLSAYDLLAWLDARSRAEEPK